MGQGAGKKSWTPTVHFILMMMLASSCLDGKWCGYKAKNRMPDLADCDMECTHFVSSRTT